MKNLIALALFFFSSSAFATPTIVIENQTAGSLSYLGGLVTVAANSNTTVPSQYVYPIARDSRLVYDAANGNVFINDGYTDQMWNSAVLYLNQVATSIGGAVVGQIGASAPSYVIMVGGVDASNNVQNVQVSPLGDQNISNTTSYWHTSSAGTTTIKSGVGLLYSICANTLVNSANLKLYDNTSGSGTVIASPTLTLVTALNTAYTWSPTCQYYGGTKFSTGLTAVTTGTADWTVTFK